MAMKIIMPKMSSNMEEGTIVEQLVASQTPVEQGDDLLTIETDKTTATIQAEAEGVVVFVDEAIEGTIFKVGEVLGYIFKEGESFPTDESERPKEERPASADLPVKETAVKSIEEYERPMVLATPAARHLAKVQGIDLFQVKGSGMGGRVRYEDVQTFSDAMPPTDHFFGARQRKGVQVVSESWRSAPHFSLSIDVDTGKLIEKKHTWDVIAELDGEPAISVTAMISKIVADLLDRHPTMKSRPTDDGIMVYPKNNIGFAVATDSGLVVPVIRDADKKSLRTINAESRSLAWMAQSGGLKASDLDEGVFTISNLGMYGIERFTSILIPRQSAILSVGKIEETAIVRAGQIIVRPMMNLTLTVDHRCADGSHGALFLQDLKKAIER